MNRAAFRENVLTLIDDLASANEGLDAIRERNEALISLLKDCIEHDGR